MPTLAAEELRQHWKQAAAEAGLPEDHDTSIRLHRVCRWLGESQALYAAGHEDVGYITSWISWNALYGQARADSADSAFRQMQTCISALLQLDRNGFLEGWAYQQRGQLAGLLENPFLSRWFWNEIDADHEVNLRMYVDRGFADRLIEARQWPKLLEEMLGRLYVLRNQLMHGGSTPGGSVNRAQLAQGRVLEPFLIAALQTLIHSDNKWHDWGPLPYPVLEAE